MTKASARYRRSLSDRYAVDCEKASARYRRSLSDRYAVDCDARFPFRLRERRWRKRSLDLPCTQTAYKPSASSTRSERTIDVTVTAGYAPQTRERKPRWMGLARYACPRAAIGAVSLLILVTSAWAF